VSDRRGRNQSVLESIERDAVRQELLARDH
jgi:hypothetical protein